MNTSAIASDRVLCHCLNIKASQVETCVSLYGCESVREVRSQCGAGGGCTACHARIREVIAAQTSSDTLQPAEFVAEGESEVRGVRGFRTPPAN